MDREDLDNLCERSILGLVLGILVFAPLAFGAVDAWAFLVVQGLTIGVMLVWALLEILASLGMILRRTWGRALGTVVGLFGGLFMTLILVGSVGALREADTVGSTGVGGAVLVAIVAAVFVGYWFTLLACITGGTHFRRR